MRSITVEHTISVGHRLPSYDGICSSPHGHNIRVCVTVVIPASKPFLDFKAVSDVLKSLLEPLDHAMVLHADDPLAYVLTNIDAVVRKENIVHGQSMHPFRVVRLSVEPTTENLATLLYNEVTAAPALVGYSVAAVVVHETAKYAATAMSGDLRVRRI